MLKDYIVFPFEIAYIHCSHHVHNSPACDGTKKGIHCFELNSTTVLGIKPQLLLYSGRGISTIWTLGLDVRSRHDRNSPLGGQWKHVNVESAVDMNY